MSLDNISPSKGSNRVAGKRLGRGQASGKGGTLQEGTKEPNLVLVIQENWF